MENGSDISNTLAYHHTSSHTSSSLIFRILSTPRIVERVGALNIRVNCHDHTPLFLSCMHGLLSIFRRANFVGVDQCCDEM